MTARRGLGKEMCRWNLHAKDEARTEMAGRVKRKAAGLFGLAALLEAGVLFAHHLTEAGDF